MTDKLRNVILMIATSCSLVFTNVNSAYAAIFNFNWTGDAGYSAVGSFTIDNNPGVTQISVTGPGPQSTVPLRSLSVSFFNPTQALLASYDNIINGSLPSPNTYFIFNFDLTTNQMFGQIDIGGELPGEYYLSGTVGTNMSLNFVPNAGPDEVLDQNSGSIEATSVPEPSAALALLSLGFFGLLRHQNKT